MGFTLYLIADDGEYVHYGKEIEVYLNHEDVVAMFMFLISKMEVGKKIYLRRFGLHDSDAELCVKDVSEEYLQYVKEEVEI